MLKGVVVGFVLAVIILVGGVYYYFAAGMAPVAIADPLMPFERKPARRCTRGIAPCVTGCPASHPPTMRPSCFPDRPSCFAARA